MAEPTAIPETTWKEEAKKGGGSIREYWKPSRIDEGIDGLFIGMFSGSFGQEPHIDHEGKVVVLPKGTMLIRQLADQDVKPGDHVIVIYKGKKSTGKPNPMNVFEVKVTHKD